MGLRGWTLGARPVAESMPKPGKPVLVWARPEGRSMQQVSVQVLARQVLARQVLARRVLARRVLARQVLARRVSNRWSLAKHPHWRRR